MRTLTDSLLAAWLAGAQEVVQDVPALDSEVQTSAPTESVEVLPGLPLPSFGLPPVEPPPPRFTDAAAEHPDEPEPVVRFPLIEAAARDLAQRRVMVRADFDRLADQAKRTAFTVARVGSLDALQKLQQALTQNVSQGGTLQDFRNAVDEALSNSALSAGHVENIYRTNVAQAYSQAQREMLDHPLVNDEFPYVEYHSVHDQRRRPEHGALEKLGIQGTNVYRRDDPVIQKFWPPWDYQCRCAVIPLTLEDAAARGIREAQEWLQTGIPPAQPSFVSPPPFEPPAGFGEGMRLSLVQSLQPPTSARRL